MKFKLIYKYVVTYLYIFNLIIFEINNIYTKKYEEKYAFQSYGIWWYDNIYEDNMFVIHMIIYRILGKHKDLLNNCKIVHYLRLIHIIIW